MNKLYFGVALLCLVFCSLVIAEDAVINDNDVVVLSETDHKLTKTGFWFVEYYAPWCGFCKQLAPTWAEFAALAKEDNLPFKVAKIDCTQASSTCLTVGAHGYPTILLWLNGKSFSFTKGRSIENFLNFFEENKANAPPPAPEAPEAPEAPAPPAEPATHVVNLSQDSFDSTIAKGFWIIKFYAPWCGHCKRLAPAWEELATLQSTAQEFGVAKVDCTIEKDLGSKYGVRGFPTLKLFKDGQFVEDFKGPRNIEDIVQFVKSHK